MTVMYNQYLDDSDFILLDPEPHSHPTGQDRQNQSRHNQPHPAPHGQRHPGMGQSQNNRSVPHPKSPVKSKNDLLGEVTGGLSQLLDGVLKHFSLENFDTGDILLVLIILFLYLESGDNLELVITLGLLLLLGLGDDKPKDGDTPQAAS